MSDEGEDGAENEEGEGEAEKKGGKKKFFPEIGLIRDSKNCWTKPNKKWQQAFLSQVELKVSVEKDPWARGLILVGGGMAIVSIYGGEITGANEVAAARLRKHLLDWSRNSGDDRTIDAALAAQALAALTKEYYSSRKVLGKLLQ